MVKLIVTVFIASVVIGGHLPIAAGQEMQKKNRNEMGMHGMEMMKEMDRNDDGMISKEEFMQVHEEMFAHMDQDNDGMLDMSNMNMMGMMHRCMMMRHAE